MIKANNSQLCTIRCFEPSDIETIIAINRASLPENYSNKFFLDLYHHAPKAFLVAVIDNNIVGYITCEVKRGVSNFKYRIAKMGHIVSVAVIDKYRGCGFGTKLIETATKEMLLYKATELYLEVRKSNEVAVSIYKKFGYEIKDCLDDYYEDGENGYLMTKKC